MPCRHSTAILYFISTLLGRLRLHREHTKVKQFPQVGPQRNGDNHLSDAKVDIVYHKHRNDCKGWNKHLVSPSYIEQVISNAEQHDVEK